MRFSTSKLVVGMIMLAVILFVPLAAFAGMTTGPPVIASDVDVGQMAEINACDWANSITSDPATVEIRHDGFVTSSAPYGVNTLATNTANETSAVYAGANSTFYIYENMEAARGTPNNLYAAMTIDTKIARDGRATAGGNVIDDMHAGAANDVADAHNGADVQLRI